MSNARPLRPIRKEELENLKHWYPENRALSDPPLDDIFEIGLAISGGQSAGCYLAGVLDFLFEALDSWYAARRADPDKFPNHRIKVKIIVGASAGGLNTALAAVCATHRFAPASYPNIEDADRNLTSPFYRAWVRDIDIRYFLSTDDLSTGQSPFSLFNTHYLDRKVATYIKFAGNGTVGAKDRDWLDDPLPIKITTSNLDDVPYRIRFTAAGTDEQNAGSYPQSLHRDYLAFVRPVSAAPTVPLAPDHDVLSLDNTASDPSWDRLAQAGLATIAFPIALKQRVIERPSTDYEYRFAYPFASGGLVYAPPFPGESPSEKRLLMLDGGVMDNEPIVLAHAALAGSAGTNERRGDKAKRAIILVDPFVSEKTPASGGQVSFPRIVAKVWDALVSQSRFKPIDLALAEADEVYSRFLIAPVRHGPNRTARGHIALASHPLDAFFGYFSEHYRHHDFMLGRQNCYKFLRDWFVLPSRHSPDAQSGDPQLGNTLFAKWPKAALADSSYLSKSPACPNHRQIIPLVGSAAQEPQTYPWPAGKFAGYSAVEGEIKARVDALYPLCRDPLLKLVFKTSFVRWLGRIAVNTYWSLTGRRRFLAAIAAMIDQARDKLDND